MDGTNELIFRLDSRDTPRAIVEFAGREIRFWHNIMGETYASISKRTGIPAEALSRIARERVTYPRMENVLPLLAALDLDYDPVRKAITRRDVVVPIEQAKKRA